MKDLITWEHQLFSHILGYTRKISSEEMERYADSDRNYIFDLYVAETNWEVN